MGDGPSVVALYGAIGVLPSVEAVKMSGPSWIPAKLIKPNSSNQYISCTPFLELHAITGKHCRPGVGLDGVYSNT